MPGAGVLTHGAGPGGRAAGGSAWWSRGPVRRGARPLTPTPMRVSTACRIAIRQQSKTVLTSEARSAPSGHKPGTAGKSYWAACGTVRASAWVEAPPASAAVGFTGQIRCWRSGLSEHSAAPGKQMDDRAVGSPRGRLDSLDVTAAVERDVAELDTGV